MSNIFEIECADDFVDIYIYIYFYICYLNKFLTIKYLIDNFNYQKQEKKLKFPTHFFLQKKKEKIISDKFDLSRFEFFSPVYNMHFFLSRREFF